MYGYHVVTDERGNNRLVLGASLPSGGVLKQPSEMQPIGHWETGFGRMVPAHRGEVGLRQRLSGWKLVRYSNVRPEIPVIYPDTAPPPKSP
jgi:hypothetical protein